MSRPKTGSADPNAVALAWKRNVRQLPANREPTRNAASTGAARAIRSSRPGISSCKAALFSMETVRTRPRVARTIARWLA